MHSRRTRHEDGGTTHNNNNTTSGPLRLVFGFGFGSTSGRPNAGDQSRREPSPKTMGSSGVQSSFVRETCWYLSPGSGTCRFFWNLDGVEKASGAAPELICIGCSVWSVFFFFFVVQMWKRFTN